MSLAFWKKRAPTRTKPPVIQPVPAPSSTGPIRVTDERDGELLNRGYAYWSAAHIGPDGLVTLFVGHADGQPRFFNVNLDSRTVLRLGALLPYAGTGEGWYFDRDGFIYLCDGPFLRRVHPLTGSDVVVLDISTSLPGSRVWQAHSSDDGTTHSATVERITSDGPYERLGTVVQRHGTLRFIARQGTLDESQVDASGRYLVIKEDDDNRILDLVDGSERRITNAEGALGHSDCGTGIIVGENDQIGACVSMDLATLQQRPLFSTWNMGVVSVRAERCIVTDQTQVKLVALDGSSVRPLVEHGMQGSGYDFLCRANLDPTGRVAMYISNAADGRMDAYLLPI